MFIAVTGCDGTGKTAAVANVACRLQAAGLKSQVIDTWSINDPSLYPECRFLSANTKQIKECGNEMASPERAMFLFWIIAHSSRLIKPEAADTCFIADGYWAKHAANEVVRGFPEHIALAIADLLPRPDITFLLRASASVTLKRKRSQVTRFECGSETENSEAKFLEFQGRLQTKLDHWSAQRNWVNMDAAQAATSIHEKIFDCIMARTDRKPASLSA